MPEIRVRSLVFEIENGRVHSKESIDIMQEGKDMVPRELELEFIFLSMSEGRDEFHVRDGCPAGWKRRKIG